MEAERVAILSDVHGNAAALEAVLEDLAAETVDAVVLAGDYALFGPRPGDAVERLQELAAVAVVGNTDRALLAHPHEPIVKWTRERLAEQDLAWLEECVFGCTVHAPSKAELLLVHATPTDVEGILVTEANENTPWPVTPEAEAIALLGDARADLIVYGHIHYASGGLVGAQRVASIGSVGFPADGDPRAAYAIAQVEGDHWRVEHRRVAYDHAAVAAEIRNGGAPHAEIRAQRIEQARFIPFG